MTPLAVIYWTGVGTSLIVSGFRVIHDDDQQTPLFWVILFCAFIAIAFTWPLSFPLAVLYFFRKELRRRRETS